jgi:hypothetical protein
VRRFVSLALVLAAIVAAGPAAPARAASPAPVGHIFVIVLENEDAETTFGPDSPAPYLSQQLPQQGQVLEEYYGIGHVSLDNYIAMVSGQAPNPITQSDCQNFTDFLSAGTGPNGQEIGTGCVFPANVRTVADQLEAVGRTWRGYMGSMGTPCRHPAVGTTDDTQQAEPGDMYATRHNPFMYFHSIIDEPSCAQHVVDLSSLPADLASASTTPDLAFITPDLCDDGHDAPCADGRPGGLESADAFLQTWVPQILGSAAFQQDGLLIITFDEAETGDPSSATACCGEQPGPNSPVPGIDGPGGGRTGAVVLSRFVEPGTTNATPYNHYALLRTIEDAFGLEHLGFAAAEGLAPFGPDVFGRPTGVAPTTTATTAAPVATTAGSRSPQGGGALPATGGWGTVELVLAGAALASVAGARWFLRARTRP